MGCHFLLQGTAPTAGIEPASPASAALAGEFFSTVPPGSPRSEHAANSSHHYHCTTVAIDLLQSWLILRKCYESVVAVVCGEVSSRDHGSDGRKGIPPQPSETSKGRLQRDRGR